MINRKRCAIVSAVCGLALFAINFLSEIRIASAVGQEFNFPQEWISSDVNADQYRNYFAALQSNPEFIGTYPDEYVVMISEISNNEVTVVVSEPNTFFSVYQFWSGETIDFYTGKYTKNTVSASLLNSYTFTTHSEILPVDNTNYEDNFIGMKTDSESNRDWVYGMANIYRGAVNVGSYGYAVAVFTGTNDHPFDPIIDPIYNATYSLYINDREFTEWLINNERYYEINSAMLANHVSDTVGIFKKYGANNAAFARLLKQFFDLRNIGQGVTDYNVAISKIRELYREFESERKQELLNKFYGRTEDTENIKPDTNETNNTLITNLGTDDIYTQLLRDILRALIAMQNNLGDLLISINDKLDNLDNTVNIVNDSGIDDIDFSELWVYDSDSFNDDLETFSEDVASVQQLPVQYVTTISRNALMPENMLSDKDSLSVNIPNISGFTVSNNGKAYSTQTTTYNLKSTDYPWLDPLVKKIKRFTGIMLIIGYLVHLRYKIPELVRGE